MAKNDGELLLVEEYHTRPFIVLSMETKSAPSVANEMSIALVSEGAPTGLATFWDEMDKKKKTERQLPRYISAGSPSEIKRFIEIGGGVSMGTTLEEFARFRFKNLAKRNKGRKETGYDHIIKAPTDIYVEQKSSGYWVNKKKDDFHWQHLEEAHKWDMLLLCGIGYTEVHFWAMSRATFRRLVVENKITNQGDKAKTSSEGKWFWYSDVKDSLTEIRKAEELQAFAASLRADPV